MKRFPYVERPSSRVATLAIAITLFSAIDALLTLFYVTDGGIEANPYAAHLLSYGHLPFVSLKMAATGLGVWVLAALHQVMLAYVALHGITAVYLIVLAMHALNWFRG